MSFLSAYSLAAILGGTCLGIVVTVIALAPILRRHAKAPEALPEPTRIQGFLEPSRPVRCARCGGSELVHVPRLVLASAGAPPPMSGPLAVHEASRPVELEMLVCAGCGHAEWFAVSPRTLEPFRSRANGESRLPYRS
ncbi:MAG TPA: hypothetical protein VKN99_05945 [Polyangia bacterium]|nr:hypothetical protein [Polyangia bacterium]